MKIAFKKERGILIPFSDEDVEKLKKMSDGAIYEVDIKNIDIRSMQQNKSLHLWCGQIANTLNHHGLYVSQVIKADTTWTMETVKENIFKAVVKSLYNKNSTTKLNKNEFEKIIDVISLALGNKGVVVPPFPNREEL